MERHLHIRLWATTLRMLGPAGNPFPCLLTYQESTRPHYFKYFVNYPLQSSVQTWQVGVIIVLVIKDPQAMPRPAG